MVDLDGCANGQVRSNANGYDVNMHWREVDLRRPGVSAADAGDLVHEKSDPRLCPTPAAGTGSSLLVNMHNTETAEYLDTVATDAETLKLMRPFRRWLLAEKTTFDRSTPLTVRQLAPDDTNSLSGQQQIPVLLMEQRISTSKKLGRRPTTQDRLDFGKQLVEIMAGAVLQE